MYKKLALIFRSENLTDNEMETKFSILDMLLETVFILNAWTLLYFSSSLDDHSCLPTGILVSSLVAGIIITSRD